MSLKRLTIFDDSDKIFRHNHGWLKKTRFRPDRDLTLTLMEASQHLQQLSLSFIVDASDFFRLCRPSDTEHPNPGLFQPAHNWQHLTSLTLTSKVLKTPSHSPVNDLLLAAAMAAMKVPKLELMEIWNAKDRKAGIFRYDATAAFTKITWQCTADLSLSKDVQMAWGKVADAHTLRELSVEYVQRPRSVKHIGSALTYMMSDVLHPVSAYRMQQRHIDAVDLT